MSSENNENLFSNLDDFYSFPCPSALTRTSKTMLNKSGENGNHLIPDFRETAFRFSQQSMMLNVSLSYMAFVNNYVYSMPISLGGFFFIIIIINKCGIF